MNQKLIGPGLRKKQSFEHQLFFLGGGIIQVGIFHLEQENPSVFLSAHQLWFLFAGGGIQATELFCFGFHRRKMKGPKWSTQGSLLFVGKFVALGVVFGKVFFFLLMTFFLTTYSSDTFFKNCHGIRCKLINDYSTWESGDIGSGWFSEFSWKRLGKQPGCLQNVLLRRGQGNRWVLRMIQLAQLVLGRVLYFRFQINWLGNRLGWDWVSRGFHCRETFLSNGWQMPY